MYARSKKKDKKQEKWITEFDTVLIASMPQLVGRNFISNRELKVDSSKIPLDQFHLGFFQPVIKEREQINPNLAQHPPQQEESIHSNAQYNMPPLSYAQPDVQMASANAAYFYVKNQHYAACAYPSAPMNTNNDYSYVDHSVSMYNQQQNYQQNNPNINYQNIPASSASQMTLGFMNPQPYYDYYDEGFDMDLESRVGYYSKSQNP